MAIHFTPRELDVMGVLWRRGEAKVRDVRAALGGELAYTSVLTQLQLLEQKGHVVHRREGRSYVYSAVTPAAAAGEPALGRMLERLYQNSPVKLLAQLVDSQGVSPAELEAMRDLIEEKLGGGGEGRGDSAASGQSAPAPRDRRTS